MKTNNRPFAIALLVLGFLNSGFVIDGKYEQAMKKNIDAVYKAKSIDEYQQAINAFERIGATESEYWEPQYYSAFGYVMMFMLETENAKKDQMLDQALAAVKKAKDIAGEESEVVALEGFVHMMRVTVDPATRGPQYSGLAMEAFGKAVGLNPENPRALVLMAQMQYGTAQFFGSSTAEACENVKKALEKFDTFKSDNTLAPRWGKPMAESLKSQCK
jgi:tetratricopeptide (TPR) repeat protein